MLVPTEFIFNFKISFNFFLGLSLPSSVTTWVAIRGMPEVMANVRLACLERRKWQKNQKAIPSKINSKEPSYLETPKQYTDNNANYA